jgi:hypothetical protein
MSNNNEIVNSEMEMPVVKYWNGQRVVTFKDIDLVHDRPNGTARKRFHENKKHFIESVDYFLIKPNARQTYNEDNSNVRLTDIEETLGKIPPRGLTLITETGYLMIVKSFTDDLSWEVQRKLVNGYFRAKEIIAEQDNRPKIEDTQTFRTSNTLLPKNPDWYQRNRRRLFNISDRMNLPLNRLYHHILVRLGEEYDLDNANKIYEKEMGYPPEYPMDIVSYFPQLSELATSFLDTIERKLKEMGK